MPRPKRTSSLPNPNEARRVSTLSLKTFLQSHISSTLSLSLPLRDILLYPSFYRRLPYTWSFTNGYALPKQGMNGKSMGMLTHKEREAVKEAVGRGWMKAVMKEVDDEGRVVGGKRRKVVDEGESGLFEAGEEEEEDSKKWIHTDSEESGEGESESESEEEEEAEEEAEEEEEIIELEDEADEDFCASDESGAEEEPAAQKGDAPNPTPKSTPKQVRFSKPLKTPTPKTIDTQPNKTPKTTKPPTPTKPITPSTSTKRKRSPPTPSKTLAALLAENKSLRAENILLRNSAPLTFTQTFDFGTNKQPLVVSGAVDPDGESVKMSLTSGRNEASFTLRLDDR